MSRKTKEADHIHEDNLRLLKELRAKYDDPDCPPALKKKLHEIFKGVRTYTESILIEIHKNGRGEKNDGND